MNNIEKQILQRITPTYDYREKIKQIVKEIKNILENEIKRKNLPVIVELVGSVAKDTYLQKNMDIDFFICFPTDYSKEEIAKQALQIGKTYLKDTEESYAEHPYLRGYYKNFYVELVPCYMIEHAKQKLSAVDRTPLHTKYIIENIKDNQKHEVRLLKQFLKGINCYGAEAQIQGFSGYLCEIMILKYDSFQNTLNKAKEWKLGEKLSLSEGNYPDFDTPLVFIDPVDPNRNVASALSKEKFNLFIKASNKYLKKPKVTYFFPNPVKSWNLKKIKKIINKQDCRYFGIKFQKPNIIDENLYPQIRKTVRATWDNLERYGFKVFNITYFVDEIDVYIVIKTQKEPLKNSKIHIGPPVKKQENSVEFLKKWENNPLVIKGPYKENNRWYVEIKREYLKIKDFLENEFEKFSLGKNIDKIVYSRYNILGTDELLSDNLKSFWTNYLDKKNSWEY